MRIFEETADGDAAVHVEGDVDPIRDLEIIAAELRQKDIAHMSKARRCRTPPRAATPLDRSGRSARSNWIR